MSHDTQVTRRVFCVHLFYVRLDAGLFHAWCLLCTRVTSHDAQVKHRVFYAHAKSLLHIKDGHAGTPRVPVKQKSSRTVTVTIQRDTSRSTLRKYHGRHSALYYQYGVPTISRLLKIIGLFCKISSLL